MLELPKSFKDQEIDHVKKKLEIALRALQWFSKKDRYHRVSGRTARAALLQIEELESEYKEHLKNFC